MGHSFIPLWVGEAGGGLKGFDVGFCGWVGIGDSLLFGCGAAGWHPIYQLARRLARLSCVFCVSGSLNEFLELVSYDGIPYFAECA
jgi:hypothetical protein